MLDAADLPQSVHQIQSIRSHKAPPRNRIAHSPTPDKALYHETAVNEAALLMPAMVFHMVFSCLNIVANSRGNAVYAKPFDGVVALACARVPINLPAPLVAFILMTLHRCRVSHGVR